MTSKPGAPRNILWRNLSYLASGLTIAAALLLSGGSAPANPSAPANTPEIAPEQIPAGLRTIVLDPGHGGQAVGAVAPGGIREKDVTLDIAVRLRELIFRRIGLQVFLTRESDVDVPHDQRTEKANNWAADLFISIHANSFRLDDIRGPETYFLSASATDRRAQELATIENGTAADRGSSATPPEPSLDFILWDLAQTQHLRESSLLAEMVQTNLNGVWQLQDRGVKQAPFRVLKGATMPAILVEVGYLSNSNDALRLADPFFRQQVAEALFDSLSSFRQQFAVLEGAGPND